MTTASGRLEMDTQLPEGWTRLGLWLWAIDIGPAPGQTTIRWDIRNRLFDSHLGMIHWFPRWRQYCFWPTEDSVFSADYLDAIQQFLKTQNAEHRNERQGGLT